MKIRSIFAIFALTIASTGMSEESPPYPPSAEIGSVEFDWATHSRAAPGSDNWPVTWADDGHLYSAWGDGGGFEGTNQDGRVSLGVARIEGGWADHQGVNVWGGVAAANEATFPGKSYGILCVDGVLYMWVGMAAPNKDPFKDVRIAASRDHGATWERADWAFTREEGVMLPTFLNFGQDYGGSKDEYVYSYLIRYRSESGPDSYEDKVDYLVVQRPGTIDLARVPKTRVLEREAWEFFAGLDIEDQPAWTAGLEDRKPVFEDSNGVGWNVSVTHLAGQRRYFLCTEHTETHRGKLGIFDAPEPWGPWTTVLYESAWGEGHVPVNTFFWNFVDKWSSEDGSAFSLTFTGRKENDSWNVIRGTFRPRVDDR